MPTYGWRQDDSVKDWLFAEPFQFEFTQAIRIIEQIALLAQANQPADRSAKDQVPLGAGPEPSREAVRLRSYVGFDFLPSELRAMRVPADSGSSPELIANIFSLAGASAPLPDWVAELLLQQARDRDYGLRDFLDIFHHRLLSLLYRSRLHHRPWLAPVASSPDPKVLRTRNRMSQYLLSFAGLGVHELQGRLAIADEELLPYAGLLWQRARSMVALERILQHALAVPVRGRRTLGTWRRIEPEDRTHLGGRIDSATAAGRNCSLGRTTTLGARVWDADGRFDLHLGPLSLQQFMTFLPRGAMHRRLRAIVQFYAGDLIDVHAHLTITRAEIPRSRLGSTRLGWTSWIGTQRLRQARTITLAPL